jgi:aromatic-L-amino-acid decarboxylase
MSETPEEMTKPLGDLEPEEFRRRGYQVIDWIADYLEGKQDLPVLSEVSPGDVYERLPPSGPEEGEAWEEMLRDFEQVVLPGITHWNHPRFFAYFAITGSAPGILGEALSAALNVNGMLWRTSPSATELEQLVLEWLAEWIGLPRNLFGIITDTASISSLCALAAAREAIPDLEVRELGLAGRPEVPRLRLYTSDQAHSSVEKAALLLGLGHRGVRKIASDGAYRMSVEALRQALAEDRRDGWLPFSVVATAGTTSTTSVDPLDEIATVCEAESLWLHVDAAYAGAAAMLPERRSLFAGWEKADSVVMNPHKWLFTPIDCSALFTRRPDVLKRAFSLVPEYLRSDVAARKPEVRGDYVPVDLMDYGIQLGRRFRALKLWLVFRTYGKRGLQARLRHHIEMAEELAGWIDDHPDFERLAPTPFSTLCFRYRPGAGPHSGDGSALAEVAEDEWAALNESLLEAINSSGLAFLSHTRLRGRFALRLPLGNIRTTAADVKETWDLIRAKAMALSG